MKRIGEKKWINYEKSNKRTSPGYTDACSSSLFDATPAVRQNRIASSTGVSINFSITP
jgi:hypothetical protein